jgi:hypothetical protein
MRFLRQATASQEILLGPFVAAADGTAQTGLTIANTDIKLLLGGATAEQNKNSGGGTHIAGGRYSAVLDATDTATVGVLEVSVNPASGIPWNKSYYVLEEAIYDALFAASATGLLPANVTQFGGSNGTFASGRPEVNTTHAAGTAWNSGAIGANTLASDTITAAKVAADVTTEIQSGLATAAELAKVPKSDGTATWNATALAAIQSEANDALVAYDPPTKAELDAAVANVSVDEIQATALADLFNPDSATTYASAVAGSVVKEIADNAGGSSLTAADIADAVWDEATAGHVGAGSTGAALTAALADTNELQTDWANGGRLDLILDARSSQASVDDLPTNAELATALGAADDAVLTAIADLPTNAELTTALADLPTNAELATALGTADDAVLAAVATVDSNVDAIKAKTDSLTFTVANVLDANIQRINDVAITGDGQIGTEFGV